MEELKFKSQICTTIEQSKRLLELGLNPETADMYYTNASLPFIKDDFHIVCKEYYQVDKEVNNEISPFTFIPAWSLHRLIEMYVERYISCNINLKELTFDWLINEIEIHIKDEDFNKQYLKQ